MENHIPTTQPTKAEIPTPAPEAQPQPHVLPLSERAADILLQQMQLLLDQSRLACDPDNALNLGPNEKSRILCALAEAITAGTRTITALERAHSARTVWEGITGQARGATLRRTRRMRSLREESHGHL